MTVRESFVHGGWYFTFFFKDRSVHSFNVCYDIWDFCKTQKCYKYLEPVLVSVCQISVVFITSPIYFLSNTGTPWLFSLLPSPCIPSFYFYIIGYERITRTLELFREISQVRGQETVTVTVNPRCLGPLFNPNLLYYAIQPQKMVIIVLLQEP